MKRKKRLVYLELANTVDNCICTWCNYAAWEAEGCCEGYSICEHPLEIVTDTMECIEPGSDCWGFRPDLSLDTIVEIVSAILSNDYDMWSIRPYSRTAVTVYGRRGLFSTIGDGYIDAGSKVRIGHNGRE